MVISIRAPGAGAGGWGHYPCVPEVGKGLEATEVGGCSLRKECCKYLNLQAVAQGALPLACPIQIDDSLSLDSNDVSSLIEEENSHPTSWGLLARGRA